MSRLNTDTDEVSEEESKEILQSLKRARVSLYSEMPFFSYLVNNLDFIEAPSVTETAAVDKHGNMYYNPNFIRSLYRDEVKGVMCHEVMHVALLAHERRGDRDNHKWNIAQDIIINHMLLEEGVSLPDGVILPNDGEYEIQGHKIEDISSHTSESMYARVKEIGDQLPDSIIVDDGVIDPDDISDDVAKDLQINKPEVDWDKERNRAAAAEEERGGDSRGDEHGGMLETVTSADEGTVDYKKYINQKISEAKPTDYTYQKPSTAGRAIGEYLPSMRKEGQETEIVVLLDTSGSISTGLLSQFAAEMGHIAESFDNVNLIIIHHDTEVANEEHIKNASRHDFDEIEAHGRGGTNHVVPLNYLADEGYEPAIVVGFTDAESQFPDKPTVKSPHLWVLPADARATPDDLPFGSVSRLETQAHPDEEF